jgi:hypothetical protein
VERIRHAFQLCLTRAPKDREVQTMFRLYEEQLAASRASGVPTDKTFIEFARAARVDPAEFEAWQSIATALLNLDETITKG